MEIEHIPEANTSRIFTEWESFPAISLPSCEHGGNVIKASDAANGSVRRIELEEVEPDRPRIQVVREGEAVRVLEFLCPCGRSLVVSLEEDR